MSSYYFFTEIQGISSHALPYVCAIPRGISPGMALFVQGVMLKDAQCFAVNFRLAESDDSDITFHFNPRVGDAIYLNSFRNGSWEEELTVANNPFTKGAAFVMLIVINTEAYEVYVNNEMLCTFKHRFPLDKVSALGIIGEASISTCGFINTWDCSYLQEIIKKSGISGIHTVEKKLTVTWMLDSSETPITFDVLNPVRSPVIPFTNKIPGGIKPNMAFFFQGTLPTDAKFFSINFKTGSSDDDDRAFHFNPRIGENIYINTLRNGSWEDEETVSDKPFIKGAAFILFAVITSDGYEVYVNGLRVCTFKHRIPIEKVTTLSINGTVSFSLCGLIHNWSGSSCFNEAKKITETGSSTLNLTPIMVELSHSVSSPVLPYVGNIPIGVKESIAIFFQGTLAADADQFAINFGTGKSEDDDIAFHFNPRIGQYTALNSFRSGQWETEESAPDKPFTAGSPFYMIIVITSNGYEVYVNDNKHSTFNHRIPFEKVTVVRMFGDVSCKVISFIDNWKSSPFFKKLSQ